MQLWVFRSKSIGLFNLFYVYLQVMIELFNRLVFYAKVVNVLLNLASQFTLVGYVSIYPVFHRIYLLAFYLVDLLELFVFFTIVSEGTLVLFAFFFDELYFLVEVSLLLFEHWYFGQEKKLVVLKFS